MRHRGVFCRNRVVRDAVMRTVAVLATSIFFIVSVENAAEAQVVCSLIAKYFKNPPDGFISERGEKISKFRWKSNQSFPNSICSISQIEDEHHVGCTINNRASLDTVVAFRKSVESDIDSCLSRIPDGQSYKKTVETDTSDGIRSTMATWENDATDATYTITVSSNQDLSDAHLYNNLTVTWEPK